METGFTVGRYVGRKDTPYDFTRNGDRIQGTKRVAYFCGENLQVSEVDVREDQAALLDSLKFGETYKVTAQPYARNNRVVWVLQSAEPVR